MDEETKKDLSIEEENPMPDDDNNIIIVKCKFFTENAGMHGVGIIIYKDGERSAKRFSFGVGTEKSLSMVNLDRDFHLFEEFIITEKMNGHMAIQLSQEISNLIREDLEDKEAEIHTLIINENELEFKNYLKGIISRGMGESDSKIDIKFNKISIEEYNNMLEPDETEEKKSGSNNAETIENIYKTKKAANKVQNEICINVKLILSPVTGIPTKKLTPGMKVAVMLSDESDFGKYLGSLIQKSDKNKRGLITTKVVEVDNSSSEITKVKVEFGPGVYGVTKSSPEIMIRTVDDNKKTDNDISSEKDTAEKIKINPVFLIATGVFLLLIIFLIIVRLV